MSAVAAPVEYAARAGSMRVTFPRLLRSEWIKLWTVRATWWVLPAIVVIQSGLAWVITHFTIQEMQAAGLGFEITAADVVAGYGFSQLAVCVLAVLTVTGEYSTGMIRSTLSANPTRVPALLAKGLVVVAVTFVTGVVAIALSWAVTYPVLGEQYRIDLADSLNQQILIGAPLYLAGIALLAYAIGALLRHSAAALATVLGLLLVVETIFQAFPVRFFEAVSPYLPSTAGGRLLQAAVEEPELTPWQGYGVLVAWGLVALAAAAVLLRRRDA